MTLFSLHKPYEPTGDQPRAIEALVSYLHENNRYQTLLGITGSGKTFTVANIIAALQRPALIVSHNKTLASQLYQEFKTFFPKNAVHYFVSYYDYYQPEAYIPQTDTYIEKDAGINEFIDAMRHATTASALTRKDVIIVASVSCIYGIGDPDEYKRAAFEITAGSLLPQKKLLHILVDIQYERNEYDIRPGIFRARGDTVEIATPDSNGILRLEWDGQTLKHIELKSFSLSRNIKPLSLKSAHIFPAKHFVTPHEKLELAITNIEQELAERYAELKRVGKILEAERLKQRTRFDLKMLRETGYIHGIENYSRQLSFRKQGEPPATLLDYLPEDFITFIDESHMSIPQIRGMFAGDRARKQTLIEYGFRLPSALDNRPLTFREFENKIGQVVYVSATPSLYELVKSKPHVVEQIIRPTGLLDPFIEMRISIKDQMRDIINEIKKRINHKQRTLVTTLTKRMAEDLAEFLKQEHIKAEYLHADIKTIERVKILNDLRKGSYDVIVGVNLLREGLDLPEVSLVIILDADKEGFLRNTQTLIQTIGRAARHTQGSVLMYADRVTESMKQAQEETNRRRIIQRKYNKTHHITPREATRDINENIFGVQIKKHGFDLTQMSKKMSKEKLKEELTQEMLTSARELDFERAAELRNAIEQLSDG